MTGTDNNTNELTQLLSNERKLDKFFDNVSEKLNKGIAESWASEIEFRFKVSKDAQNNTILKIYIDDKNLDEYMYVTHRSEGFKQFLSFLVSIVLKSGTRHLKNNIILIDEPELHLHPSSVEQFRELLLELSKNNYIIVSTHSPYSVDTKKCPERHYVVKKENGKTIVEQIDPYKNPYFEEVLHNALGSSIWKLSPKYIIIFEGHFDQVLFNVFLEKFVDEFGYLNIGTTNSKGCGDIPKYLSFLNDKYAKGFAILDSDEAGRKEYDKIVRELPELKENAWILEEIVDKSKINKDSFELEDLLPEDLVIKYAEEFFKKEKEVKFDKSEVGEKAIIDYIEIKAKQSGIKVNKNKIEKLKEDISKRMYEYILQKDSDEIKKEFKLYYSFVSEVIKKVKKYEQ